MCFRVIIGCRQGKLACTFVTILSWTPKQTCARVGVVRCKVYVMCKWGSGIKGDYIKECNVHAKQERQEVS